MTAMSRIADEMVAAATEMPRFEDGSINLQEVLRRLAESVVNEVMSAEADQLCEATGNGRNGYRDRHARGVLPGGRARPRGGRARRARLPRLPAVALEAPAHQQPPGAANREIKRRSRVVQVFPSTASLERLAGAVMCDQDEAWSSARYFSEQAMAELHEGGAGREADRGAARRLPPGGSPSDRGQPRACGRSTPAGSPPASRATAGR